MALFGGKKLGQNFGGLGIWTVEEGSNYWKGRAWLKLEDFLSKLTTETNF